jgi:putative hydrolase of the HAD superfamily
VLPLIPQFERFDGLVLSCELGLAKPDAEIFKIALTRAKVRAQEAAYFDDIQRFVDAAAALGIQARQFTNAPTFRTQLVELGLVG